MGSENEQQKSEQPHVKLIMSPKALVVKANKLVEARQRLSIQEQRIILLLISKIRPEDVNFLWYKFGILDFAKFLGIEKSQGIYLDVRKAVRKLMKRIVTVDRKDRNIDLHWIEAAAYGEKGFVKICMNQVLKPYLLNLKAQFTKYNISYIVHLRSTYSIRIYELLKRFEYLGEATFSLDKLKYMLGVDPDEYTLYGNFKSKVILVAQKELLEKTDKAFTFEEEKNGKKISEIRFLIKKNDPKQKYLTPPEPPAFVCEEPIKPQRYQAQKEPRPGPAEPLELSEESSDTAENFNRLIPLLAEGGFHALGFRVFEDGPDRVDVDDEGFMGEEEPGIPRQFFLHVLDGVEAAPLFPLAVDDEELPFRGGGDEGDILGPEVDHALVDLDRQGFERGNQADEEVFQVFEVVGWRGGGRRSFGRCFRPGLGRPAAGAFDGNRTGLPGGEFDRTGFFRAFHGEILA